MKSQRTEPQPGELKTTHVCVRNAPYKKKLRTWIEHGRTDEGTGTGGTHTASQTASRHRQPSIHTRWWLHSGLLSVLCLLGTGASAQSANLAEVLASGAKRLTPDEVYNLVVGAKTVFQTVAGGERIWTNHQNGQFVASVADGASGRQFIKSFQGDWKITPDGAYCVRIVYSSVNVDRFCRFLYPYNGAHYAFGPNAQPETMSGRWNFSK